MSKNSRSNDGGMGRLVILVLAVIAMPLVGDILRLQEKAVSRRYWEWHF